MIGPLLALSMGAAPPAGDAAGDAAGLGTRIRDSAAAAQSFQGDLDGAWRLDDRNHRTLYRFQLTDSSDPGAHLEGAWREPGPAARLGVVETLERRGGTLTIRFTPGAGQPVREARLTRRGRGLWSGRLEWGGSQRRVTLRRVVTASEPD